MTDTAPAVQCGFGIDVSKDSLDIFIDSSAAEYRIANQASDIAPLVEHLKVIAPDYFIIEASGGFETALVTALATSGLPVGRVSPQRVRSFARAIGLLAKTDRLDARLLARYGGECRPPLSRITDIETAELEALLQRRRQLIEMHVAEKTRIIWSASGVIASFTRLLPPGKIRPARVDKFSLSATRVRLLLARALFSFDDLLDIKALTCGSLQQSLIDRLIHTRRARQYPQIFSARFAYQGVTIVGRKLNDLIVTPDERQEGKVCGGESHF